MINEIKRNNWSRFCRKFSASNQMRPATVKLRPANREETNPCSTAPFMGLEIVKKGRLIDGVCLFVGQEDPERMNRPIVAVKRPVRMMLQKDSRGIDTYLSVEGEDGTVVRVELSGEKAPDQPQQMIAKLAYALYERRGFTPGNDLDDWLEAEMQIRQIEQQLTQ